MIVKEKDLTRKSLSFCKKKVNQNYLIVTTDIPHFHAEIPKNRVHNSRVSFSNLNNAEISCQKLYWAKARGIAALTTKKK